MSRRGDRFWDYVVKNDAGLQQCMFCKFEFARSTSVSMVMYHLARREMGGVRICTEVPDQVKEAAELAIDGPNQKFKNLRSLSGHPGRFVMDVDPDNDVGTTAMASAASTPFSSSSLTSRYDVFLSFRGEDTRKGFTDHLHKALVNARIHTFLDDDSSLRGKNIESAILSVIESSKVAVIVFSEDFASSRWCLDKVAQIMDCTSTRGLVMIPVFYHVDPSDVCKQSGGYGKAFAAHEKKFEPENVKRWREALERVANMAGMVLGDRHESKFIEKIVKAVVSRLTTPNEPEPSAHQKTSGVASATTNLIGEIFLENSQSRDKKMGRRRDRFWDYVVKNDAGLQQCMFCEFEFARSTSVSMVMYHLARHEMGGVRICTEVPDQVKEAAELAIDGPNQKFKTLRSLSGHPGRFVMDVDQDNDVGTTVMASTASTPFSSSSLKSQYDVFLSFKGGDNCKSFTDHLHKALVNARVHTFLDDDSIPRGENIESAILSAIESSKVAVIVFSEDFASSRWCLDEVAQIMDCCTSSRGLVVIPVFYHVDPSDVRKQSGGYGEAFTVHEKKFKPERVKKWRQALETVANISGMVLGDRYESKFIEDIVEAVVNRVTTLDEPKPSAHQKTSGVALVTTNLIGETFQEYSQNIWDCLMKADVFTIGIHGMAGVGKTSLAIHINKRLLETSNPFGFVYWVTVSQDLSIYRLQTLVAEAAEIDLLNEDDQGIRAAKLYEGLTRRQNSVLILDDLWESFDLNEVGIPVGECGCKLILTSRSLEVCRQMNSTIIKVVPLSTNEARNLFWETWGHGVALPPEIREAAEGIIRKCAGLPLALKTMARTMKGVDDICKWRSALEALKESEAVEGDRVKAVFRVLESSYYRLSSTLKQCFLYCAMFPKDFYIPSTDLIGHLIAEGIIKGKKGMRADLDEGFVILNKLKRACLLEDCSTSFETFVKMNDWVRDMAVQILRANSKAMVKASKQLKELPDEENWKVDLVTVSLMDNNIKEIPSGRSPNCPNLSTLLLCHNWELKLISKSFFQKLNGLQILDLSDTGIEELPDSLSKLVNLTSLILGGCWRLKRVPSLGKLKELKKLDLSDTSIEEIPNGMELLSNLTYLDLHENYIKLFPSGILSRFSKLQYLDFGIKRVEIMEVAMLKKLEFVHCLFSDLQGWNNYILSLEGLCRYCFYLAPKVAFSVEEKASLLTLQRGNEVTIQKLDIINQVGFVALPKDVHVLLIRKCHELKSLFPAFGFSLCHPAQLVRLRISDCEGMEWLHDNLPESLEELAIVNLKNLCSLLSEERVVAQLQPPFLSIGNDSNMNNVIFSNLKKFNICGCPRMKKLFPPRLLPNLHNLEELIVTECGNMVEIIGNGPESSVCSSPTPTPVDFALPKLKVLYLYDLPELKSICSGGGNLICNSLQEITVKYCKELKRMPISLPFRGLNGKLSPPSSLQKIKIGPREWWDSVDWGHPNEKGALLPLVLFF